MIDLKEEIDYNFVESSEHKHISINLLTGKYAGTIYRYGAVSVKEDKKRDVAVLSFDYMIEETLGCDYTQSELEADSDFKNHIGNVLTTILLNNESHIGKHNA